MYSSQLNYVPLAWPVLSLVIGAFLILVVLIQVHALHFAYTRLGIRSGAALLLLLASLLGSYINLPVASLPEQQIITDQEIGFFGGHYVVPVLVDWPGTILAVNVGGALIPALLSLYLLSKNDLWWRGLLATACVAGICYLLAQPVPGVGITITPLIPPISTAVVALLIAQEDVAAVAYISGSLGTLTGADILNLDRLQSMGAPVASIGGAGTFDGVFLTGIVAVLLASLPWRRSAQIS